MPRFKLTVEYDGAPFSGWQRQANAPSVQQFLEEAFARLTGESIIVRGAGRTDAGVHALAQIAHVELSKAWRSDTIRDAMNAQLRPQPIVILRVDEVDNNFDARFSASCRHYLYRIVNRRAPLALDSGRAWLVRYRLDTDAMHSAAQRLVGRHDFSTFRDSECQAKNPIRTLERLDVKRVRDEVQVLTSARSFLHRQVRSMVGSLVLVGAGKWTADDLQMALDKRDRSHCGRVAPATGLYLLRVDYEPIPAGDLAADFLMADPDQPLS
jgi:tRNA pseudouridine38-40 synthase